MHGDGGAEVSDVLKVPRSPRFGNSRSAQLHLNWAVETKQLLAQQVETLLSFNVIAISQRCGHITAHIWRGQPAFTDPNSHGCVPSPLAAAFRRLPSPPALPSGESGSPTGLWEGELHHQQNSVQCQPAVTTSSRQRPRGLETA